MSDDVRYVQAKGLSFAYLEAGTGALAVLLHGFPVSARCWDDAGREVAAVADGEQGVAVAVAGGDEVERGVDVARFRRRRDRVALDPPFGHVLEVVGLSLQDRERGDDPDGELLAPQVGDARRGVHASPDAARDRLGGRPHTAMTLYPQSTYST